MVGCRAGTVGPWDRPEQHSGARPQADGAAFALRGRARLLVSKLCPGGRPCTLPTCSQAVWLFAERPLSFRLSLAELTQIC